MGGECVTMSCTSCMNSKSLSVSGSDSESPRAKHSVYVPAALKSSPPESVTCVARAASSVLPLSESEAAPAQLVAGP